MEDSDLRARDFEDFLAGLAGQFGPEEGFRFGDPEVEVSGIMVSWMATAEALRAAVEQGCNLMVVHENLLYPYEFQRDQHFEKRLTWTVNRERLRILLEHGITVFRAHGTLDRLLVLDAFAEALGLPEPVVKEGYIRIYDVPEMEVGDLAMNIKRRLGLEAVRVVGRSKRLVRRIGLPWGGLGLSLNVSFIESLLKYRPDVLIAGETDEYAMFYVLDADVCLIETGHSVSENIGLKKFVEVLRQRVPGVKVFFHKCGRPWRLT